MLEGVLVLSRNMIEANGKIFSALVNFVSEGEPRINLADNPRFIKSNQRDKEIIKRFRILKSEKIARLIRVAIGKLDEENSYMIVVGPKIAKNSIGEIFEFVPMNAGWFTVIISEMSVDIATDTSGYAVADVLRDRHKNASSLYDGHDFSEISEFFMPVSVFVIPSSGPLKDCGLHRIAGIFLCAKKELLNLDIPPDLINEFEKLFLEGPDNLPFEELLNSLTSLRWKDAYLDVYRCLERIFPYSYMRSLRNKVETIKPIDEMIGIVEDVLGWRVSENSAIATILTDCDPVEKQLFLNVKKHLYGQQEGPIGVELIYKIRNSIVHHRIREENIHKRLRAEDWVSLVRGLLSVVKKQYLEYGGAV
ncbi:MAG: hypothetical protein KQJ78_22755 [Deltaproteobacteria bacterium]|nr:hypothetical protein [Deltaproteobacteria bacterium]